MGKIATGFRDLEELRKWDYSGQEVHQCYGMDYVWILCTVDSAVPHFTKDKKGRQVKTEDIDIITSVEPCRFFISTRHATLVDNFGNDRLKAIVSWKPIPQLVDKGKIK